MKKHIPAETNTVKSVDGKNSTVLKYNEPPEARKPSLNWRLYVTVRRWVSGDAVRHAGAGICPGTALVIGRTL